MKLHELESVLTKKGPGPLYAVVGEEGELRDQAVRLIKRAVVPEDAGLADFNVDLVYGDESDASEILTKAQAAPVFMARRLLIVKAVDKLPARQAEALLPYLKTPGDSTTLLLVAEKLDGRTKFAQAVKAHAVVIDCGSLIEPHLVAWIRGEADRLHVRIAEDVLVLLKDLAGSHSLGVIKRELEKLAAYVPEGQVAGRADLEAIRGSEVSASVFDLAAAIGSADRYRVLRILAKNLEAGEAPLRVLGSLVWQYRQLWKAKEALREGRESEAGRLMRLPPFQVRDFLGRFSDGHLAKAFRLFMQTDSKLKGGSANAPARVLDTLGLELCGMAAATRKKVANAPPPQANRQDRPERMSRPVSSGEA